MEKLAQLTIEEYGIDTGWQYCFRARARWSELDGFSHVSHRSHLVWFEEARNAYLNEFGFALVDANVPGPVLKEIHCTYLRSLSFQDDIVVTARTKWFGTTSFEMEYAIWKSGLVAKCSAIIVWVRNQDGAKIPLPQQLVDAMVADGAIPR